MRFIYLFLHRKFPELTFVIVFTQSWISARLVGGGNHIFVLSGCARGAGSADVVQQLGVLLREARCSSWDRADMNWDEGRRRMWSLFTSPTRNEQNITLIFALLQNTACCWQLDAVARARGNGFVFLHSWACQSHRGDSRPGERSFCSTLLNIKLKFVFYKEVHQLTSAVINTPELGQTRGVNRRDFVLFFYLYSTSSAFLFRIGSQSPSSRAVIGVGHIPTLLSTDLFAWPIVEKEVEFVGIRVWL